MYSLGNGNHPLTHSLLLPEARLKIIMDKGKSMISLRLLIQLPLIYKLHDKRSRDNLSLSGKVILNADSSLVTSSKNGKGVRDEGLPIALVPY